MTTTCAGCLAQYDAVDWTRLPKIGYSCKEGHDLELRRCSRCQAPLARNLKIDIEEILESLKASMDQHKATLEQLKQIVGA